MDFASVALGMLSVPVAAGKPMPRRGTMQLHFASMALCMLSTPVIAVEKPMSKMFATWKDLDQATGIEGVSWAELQQRCKPGAGPGQTQGGWISDGSPIKGVLKEDWDYVQSIGTTHLELAAHLDAVYKKSHNCNFDKQLDEIKYDVSDLLGNTLRSKGPVALKIACMRTRGIQGDLIRNDNEFMNGWNTDWTMSREGLTLHFGGLDSEAGIVQYIRDFGFYEGGRENDYRIQPRILVAMLTGTPEGGLSDL